MHIQLLTHTHDQWIGVRENWNRKPSEAPLFHGKKHVTWLASATADAAAEPLLGRWHFYCVLGVRTSQLEPTVISPCLVHLVLSKGGFTPFYHSPPMCGKDDAEQNSGFGICLLQFCPMNGFFGTRMQGFFVGLMIVRPCKWPQVSHVGQLQSFDGDTVRRGLWTGMGWGEGLGRGLTSHFVISRRFLQPISHI